MSQKHKLSSSSNLLNNLSSSLYISSSSPTILNNSLLSSSTSSSPNAKRLKNINGDINNVTINDNLADEIKTSYTETKCINGIVYKGIFVNGELADGIIYYPYNRYLYQGTFLNFKLHGMGNIYLNDCLMQTGIFNEGKLITGIYYVYGNKSVVMYDHKGTKLNIRYYHDRINTCEALTEAKKAMDIMQNKIKNLNNTIETQRKTIKKLNDKIHTLENNNNITTPLFNSPNEMTGNDILLDGILLDAINDDKLKGAVNYLTDNMNNNNGIDNINNQPINIWDDEKIMDNIDNLLEDELSKEIDKEIKILQKQIK